LWFKSVFIGVHPWLKMNSLEAAPQVQTAVVAN
jgi:hypothetical protein